MSYSEKQQKKKTEYSANHDCAFWQSEIKRYKAEFRQFKVSAEKTIDVFRDGKTDDKLNSRSRYNIFWSNVKTLKPAIYSRPPKIEVSRRYKDRDDVSRVACMILERAMHFEMTQYTDFDSALSNCVDDRLIVGRGTAWIRYEPEIEEITSDNDDSSESVEHENSESVESDKEDDKQSYEQITDERTPIDYVFWDDFLHSQARTWEEVTWVARRVYMTKADIVKRFGAEFSSVPLTYEVKSKNESIADSEQDSAKKAVVYEIWCRDTKKVYWIAESFEKFLDEKDDPTNFQDFFPCSKPLYATTTTDSLVPVSDYKIYQDQARELNKITSRIDHLTDSMKVFGIYAAGIEDLSTLFSNAQDARLVPITNWQPFIEKGGLAGAIQFVPLGDIIQALQQLYQAREACIQIIYQVTGISDIVRGASTASETATAQQIKSQYASIRLNNMKDDVARFARDLLRKKAEVICDKYQDETLLKIADIMNGPDAQFAQPALALLRNEPMRNFQIDIDVDSLVQMNEQQDKQDRMEFLTTTSNFLEKAVQLSQVQPAIAPILMQMLLFGVRGFKIGQELEGVFEQAEKDLQAAAPQDPQMQQQQQQAQEQQQQQQIQQQQQQMQAQQMQQQQQIQMQQDFEMRMTQMKAQIDAQSRLQVEQIKQEAETLRQRERIQAEIGIEQIKSGVQNGYTGNRGSEF